MVILSEVYLLGDVEYMKIIVNGLSQMKDNIKSPATM